MVKLTELQCFCDPHFLQHDVKSYLGVVGTACFGHCTLTVNKEAIPPSLFGQGVLVALRDVVIQLILFAADGLDVLRDREGDVKQTKKMTNNAPV